LQKETASRFAQIKSISPPSRPLRGVRDRHGRWRGMRWTRRAADEQRCLRTVKSCGPDASTPASSFAEYLRGDGDKKARSPGRVRSKPLKPLRGECRVISGVTVVTTLVCFFISHARLRAQWAPGIPCALPRVGETIRKNPGAFAPRDCETVSSHGHALEFASAAHSGFSLNGALTLFTSHRGRPCRPQALCKVGASFSERDGA
jgi:hypothetical protein